MCVQPEMLQWIERKACKYTSPENQNEIISIMALQVLREIASSIRKARFFTLMAMKQGGGGGGGREADAYL